jgi:predicted anti-sigma-YlaC factor YlaD
LRRRLGRSLSSIIRYRAAIRRNCPEEVREAVDRAPSWKEGAVCRAAVFILLGVVVAAIGFLLKA